MNVPSLDRPDTLAAAFAAFGRGDDAETARLVAARLATLASDPDARQLRGALALRRGDVPAAVAEFAALARERPRDATSWANLAGALGASGRHAEAVAACDRALEVDPGFAAVLRTRADNERHLGRHVNALRSLDLARAAGLCDTRTLLLRADTLMSLERYEDAIATIDEAAALAPLEADAWAVRGAANYQLQRLDAARADLERALALDPDQPSALTNRAHLHAAAGRAEQALHDVARAVAVRPDGTAALGDWYLALRRCADWTRETEVRERVLAVMATQPRLVMPFVAPFAIDGVREQAALARAWAPPTTRAALPARPQRDRPRVGYVSTDFRDHPVGHHVAGLFAAHDRTRVEVVAVATGPDDGSAPRRRVAGDAERFVSLETRSDDELLAGLRALELDVVVDLNGLTDGSRIEVFARGVAPVQVQYLGWAGTTGSDAYDYVIADRVVLTADARREYTERVIDLPETFFPTDRLPTDTAVPTSRDAQGLPLDAPVLCAFHGAAKLTPDAFEAWCAITAATPAGVLWLQAAPQVRSRLRAAATAKGLDTGRLVFAERVPDRATHLARLSLADLFLDAWPYGAHSTAADALAAGVPVLTLAGRSFAARVATSLVAALGVPDLAVADRSAYVALAIALANDPDRRRDLRTRVAAARSTGALFDPARTCRHLEAAFVAVHARHRRGEPPADLAVAVQPAAAAASR
jgi:predicted O-linked N-acetylglucosamine transferase (SPINDLY family)